MKEAATFGKESIILVDDDADDRELFAEAMDLVHPRVNIIMKQNGEELSSYLLTRPGVPDLIFLDLNMPKKNGHECLVDLRNSPLFKRVPVIIYTTSLNPVEVDETFRNGASRFFRKPNSFEELKQILNSILFSRARLSPGRRDEFIVSSTRQRRHEVYPGTYY